MKIRVKKDLILEVGMEGPVRGAMQDKLDPEKMSSLLKKREDQIAQSIYQMFAKAKEDPEAALQQIGEIAGLLPGIGNFADILAGLLALHRDKPVEAIFNFLAALPVLGLGARVASKAFFKAASSAGLSPAQAITNPEIWKEAWRTTGPTFQRAFGSGWLSRLQGQKPLEDIEAARKELNKILKGTPYTQNLSGFINDHFLKLSFFVQAALIGLQLAYQQEMEISTGGGFSGGGGGY